MSSLTLLLSLPSLLVDQVAEGAITDERDLYRVTRNRIEGDADKRDRRLRMNVVDVASPEME